MPNTLMERPSADEYAPYYAGYIGLVPTGDLLLQFAEQGVLVERRLAHLPAARAAYAYAPGKWTVRDVLGHLIDTERVFTYRALSFARGDTAALPSFEQDLWAAQANADTRSMDELLDEWHAQRAATIAMVRGLPEAALRRRGVASGVEFTVRALLHIPLGHVTHHLLHLASAYGVQ
jgi:uncharacterized damage-inducible protein DinB